MASEKVPREQIVAEEMLKELHITNYEPAVLSYIMDFSYKYITSVLEDAKVYSAHASKKSIDIEDLRLAVKLQLDKTHTTLPPKEFLMKIAKDKNAQPLPPIPEGRAGVRLPPERYCLTNSNITIRPKGANSSSSIPQNRYNSYNVKLENQHSNYPSYPASTYSTPNAMADTFMNSTLHSYSGNVYGKRKREPMDYTDYD